MSKSLTLFTIERALKSMQLIKESTTVRSECPVLFCNSKFWGAGTNEGVEVFVMLVALTGVR